MDRSLYEIAREAHTKHTGRVHDLRGMPQDPPSMAELSKLVLEGTYGTSWSREELDMRTKSFLSLAITATLGAEEQFKKHVRSAARIGITKDEIVAMLIHFMAYLGAPRTSISQRLVREVWQETPPQL